MCVACVCFSRLTELSAKCSEYRTAFNRTHTALHSARSLQQTRAELLSGGSSQRPNLNRIETYSRTHESLQRSNEMMDDLQEMGTKALASLNQQRGTLKVTNGTGRRENMRKKTCTMHSITCYRLMCVVPSVSLCACGQNAHRKALDVANILGLSSSLLKIIERKEGVNAWITYGCMVLTVAIVLFVYFYIKH